MATPASPPPRLASLDQFRGYTVAGMFLVNYIGGYHAVNYLLQHHNTFCSYADTIMPQFFFAVGFSFRLTYLRRFEKEGTSAAIQHAIWRNIALFIVGFAVYHVTREPGLSWQSQVNLGLWGFVTNRLSWSYIQTLVHIALTSLWVLPVIGARPAVRIAFLTFSGLAHIVLSYFWYYEWNESTRGTVDGGPLGFMTWTIPLLVGSLAYDTMVSRGSRGAVRPFLLWSVVMMAVGYALACLNVVHNRLLGNSAQGIANWIAAPPFVRPWLPTDMWTMSQHAGAVSYLTFSAGFSLLVLVGFIWVTDIYGIQVGIFRTLGVNALAGYILEDLTGPGVQALFPFDAPLYIAVLSFAIFFWLTWLFLRHLEKHKLYLRL